MLGRPPKSPRGVDRNLIFVGILLFMVAVMFRTWTDPMNALRIAPWSEVVEAAKAGRVERVVQNGESITVSLKNGTGETELVRSVIPPTTSVDAYAALADVAPADKPFSFEAKPAADETFVYIVFGQILPAALMIGLLLWIFRRSMPGGNGGIAAFTKMKSRVLPTTGEGAIGFESVAGAEEAKAELMEVVEFLKNPARFERLGAKAPRGVLLVGPPGCGKTMLARAVAGEAKVAFFRASASEFVEMFVGVGAGRVRELFSEARASAPAVVFIDELDAVGRNRGAGVGGGNDEREQTLNQLLVELDGFDIRSGIVLLAATNRPDVLDPALLRPGRFDRRVTVELPDVKGREGILGVHAKGKTLGSDVDLAALARRTPGMSGADLENVLNEAAILAARRHLGVIGAPEVSEAIERVIMGPARRSRILSDVERRRVALHEAGHALVGWILTACDPVVRVSILPRGFSLGATTSVPDEDRYLRTESELRDRLAQALGGLAAERIEHGEPSTGAADDIMRGTDLARRMVTEWGMSRLGPVRINTQAGGLFLRGGGEDPDTIGNALSESVDAEIRRLVEEGYARAEALLRERMTQLESLIGALLAEETIETDRLVELLGQRPGGDLATA